MGIVALAEIVIALFFSKKVFQRNGKPAHLNQIAQVFEKMFNCSFGSIYDQEVITALMAKSFAESEFEKYRIVQDSLFESDFDKEIKRIDGKQNNLND